MNQKNIVIYQAENGTTQLEINLQKDTLWLNLNQISQLFERDKSVISRHIKNIYQEDELTQSSTVAFFATVQKEGNREVKREIEYYNLDLIISVGYRVNSKRGTQFRIWATNILKQHIVQGYTINEKRLKEERQRLKDLQTAIDLVYRTVNELELKTDQTRELMQVIADFSSALTILDDYDHGRLKAESKSKGTNFVLSYEKAMAVIKTLKPDFDSSLFGNEKDESFKGSIGAIYQTFGGEDVYPSIEEKAANLLYFVTKNHSFSDGNKRIAAALFIYFLNEHHLLYTINNTKRIADGTLAALTLLIAQSKPEEKEVMVKVVSNLME
jgi:prophage maintenance system killer protein